jgi:class 3 adenylate cyclase
VEPQVQYARTSDGVSIAFASMGEGPPLVRLMPPGMAHVQRDWSIYSGQSWTRTFRLIWYDPRGTGLSDRDAIDFSMEAMMRDLDAVIDRTGLRSFAVVAVGYSVAIAVTYAATFPDRVEHLILANGWTKFSDFAGSPGLVAQHALIDKDWTVYTETMARVLVGFDDPRIIDLVGEHIRACIEPEAARAFAAATMKYDVSALLPGVKASTLVLHSNSNRIFPVRAGQKLAAGIQDARFLAMDDVSLEHVAALVQEFAGGGHEATAPTELPEGMAVILFADIVESTALTEKLGDAAFRAKARELDTSLRAVIRECSGTPVEGKLVGDGVLAVFTSARQAIKCALRCNGAGESVGLKLHLGIHAGDVIREGNNVYGGAVNIAARIAGASAPGEVLVSDTVRGLARTSAGVAFDDRGEHELKGVAEAQRLFAVRGSA